MCDECDRLRAKLRETKRYLRAANKGAERNAIALQLAAARNAKFSEQLNEAWRQKQ